MFELQIGAQLSENQTREIVAFLAEYGFVEMDQGNEKVRISNTAKELFAQATA